jgi:hypothetical protein
LLAYWTAFFKHYHPEAFFAASAKHYKDGEHDMLRDAARHGLKVLPPSIRRPQSTWTPASEQPAGAKVAIRAGLTQIDNIGDAKAKLLLEKPMRKWSEITQIPGIGPKTLEKIKVMLRKDDPFGIYELENSIDAVKAAIRDGKLVDDGRRLPYPTHSSAELDDAPTGTRVVWVGRMVKKNIRDIFEVNAAKKGEALDPKDVRDPHLREFAILYARDEDDQTMVKISRWAWPKFKNVIFNLEANDILVVQGRKPRYGIMASKIWVVSPDDD